ncbi:hypothetical protein J4734_22890 [Klebsiella pneumoniae]|uniref:Uncharacterized protein n=1 Tax=Klebsiella pneumoniae TaxID=573 RepID=A0A939NPE2_KLEPN|nr:hypothetical protein [Klebsiella pneumoniae]
MSSPALIPSSAKRGETQCEAQNISRSEFTNYTCERDLLVEQACTRTASITGHYEDTSETKQIVIQSQNISFASSEAGYTGTWTAPVTGKVVAATATYSGINVWRSVILTGLCE